MWSCFTIEKMASLTRELLQRVSGVLSLTRIRLRVRNARSQSSEYAQSYA